MNGLVRAGLLVLKGVLAGWPIADLHSAGRQDASADRRRRKDSREGEGRFRWLDEEILEGIVLSEGGVAFDANRGFTRMFGYDPGEAVGLPVVELVAPEDRERVARWISSGETETGEARGLRKDGTVFPMGVRTGSTIHEGRRVHVTSILDLTERRRIEEELRREKAAVELLQAVAVAANSAPTVEEALQTALERVCAYTGWPVGHAYRLEDSAGELVSTTLWHLEDPERFEAFRNSTRDSRFASGIGLPGRVLAGGEPAWIADVRRDPNFPRAKQAGEAGIRAALGFPVLVGSEVVAVLEFFSTEVAEPDDELLDVMLHVGAQLGPAIERQRTGAAQRKSEARYRAIVDTTPDAVITMTGDGIVRSFNRGAERTFDYGAEEIVGRPLGLLMPERFRASHEAGFRRYMKTGEARVMGRTVELAGLRKSGEEFPLELSLGEMREGEGVLFTGIVRDVTERKKAEEAVLANERRFRQLFEQSVDALLVHDAGGRILDCNEEACRSLGYTREELLSLRIKDIATDLLSQEEKQRSAGGTLWERALSGGPGRVAGVHLGEHRRKDGSNFPVEVRVGSVDYDGRRLIFASARDMTERRRTEEALRRSRESLAEAQRVAHVGSWEWDLKTGEVRWSDEAYRICGFEPQQVTPTLQTVEEIFHPDDRRLFREAIGDASRTARPHDFVHRIVRPDGEVRWVHRRAEVDYSEEGGPVRMAGTIQDITERKEAEERIRASEAELRSLFAAMDDVILVLDKEGRYLKVAPSNPSLLYRPPEDLVGKTLHEAFPRGQADLFLGHIRLALETQRPVETEYSLTIDGQEIRFAGAVSPMDEDSVLYVARDVTERKEAEERLRESEERYRLVARATNEAIWDSDLSSDTQTWDGAVEALFGYPQHQVTDSAWWEERVHPEDRERVLSGIQAVLDGGGETWTEEYRFRRADGGYSVVVDRAFVVRDGEGEAVRVIGSMMDVTERKQAQEELRGTRDELELQVRERTSELAGANEELRQQAALLDLSYEPVFVWELDGGIVYWNRGCEELYGFSKEAALGHDSHRLLRTVHPMPLERFKAVLRREGQWVGELIQTTRDGRRVIVESRQMLVREPDGRQSVLETNRDVTERKRDEDTLRFLAEAGEVLASSLDYRDTLSRLARLAVPYLADWCAVDVVEEDGSLGRLAVEHEDPEKVAWAQELQERYPPDPDAPGGVPKVLRTGRSELYPEITDELLVATARDPEHLELMRRIGFVSAMIVPLVARGRTLGAITLVSAESGLRYGEADLKRAEDLARRAALAVDNALLYREAQTEISERQRAEDGLRRSETSLLAAQRIARLGNWEYDVNEDRARWSDELFRIFGFSPQEFVPAYGTFLDSIHPGDRVAVRREIVRVLRGEERSSIDYRIVRPDGEERSVHTEYEVLRDGSGKPVRMVGTIQDITERRRYEKAMEERNEELARSNRELEQFAYVASHDLQEPLRMVSSYTQLLKRRYGGELGEDADDFIDYAVDGANRMQILINDLLAYSRVGTRGGELVPTDAGDALEAAKKNLEKAVEESGAVVEAGPLPVVMGDRVQLVQLFQNLVGNAIKFRQPGRKPEVSVGTVLRGDGTWLFTVRDNGIGMDPQYAERVFVIFQRLHTRSEYPGTGIGLAICKKIVERHGGKIWVDSTPGGGSTFCFTLRPAEGAGGRVESDV